jgi:hypothetical protein
MNAQVKALLERHGAVTSPVVSELIRAIQAGEVVLCSLSEASSKELAETYRMRSQIARSQGRQAVAAQMQELSACCEANQSQPCSIWAFEGSTKSFALFELLPSHSIAGCFRFDGPFRQAQNGA